MDYQQLKEHISTLGSTALESALQAINFHLTIRNWLIGYYIVKYEQNGKDRAQYGDQLLKKLSKDLSKHLGKGASERNLYKMALFFRTYSISPTVSTKSIPLLSSKAMKSQNLLELAINSLSQIQDKNISYFFQLSKSLSWSHFVELIRIEDELERQFYEVETVQNKWSIREMKRQIDSQLFTRLCLSKNKEEVLQMAKKGMIVESPKDVIKDPYIFEFLNLPQDRSFSESDLETAIINNLQEFLLEMGKGFCFIARQKRITFNTKHYYIDLLLFNRKLKSVIVIDLKIGEFDHADAGQMNFYLNYIKKEEMEKGENPPIGIVLCASKEKAFVEFSLGGLDNKVFVSEYQVYLPTKQELQDLIEKTKRNSGLISQNNDWKKTIDELGFPKRILNCLQASGIGSIKELASKTETELLQIRNFGAISLKHVKNKLLDYGLHIANSRDNRA